jgi:TPR repeat protein
VNASTQSGACGQLRSALIGLRSLLRGWHPAAGAPYTGDAHRAKVVVGFGNALFKLGWRYERGWGVRRNLPEALRCYSKSSKLGNLDAMVRLPPAEAAAADEHEDHSLDPPVPVMPIWRSWNSVEAERHERDVELERQAYKWLTRYGVTNNVARGDHPNSLDD